MTRRLAALVVTSAVLAATGCVATEGPTPDKAGGTTRILTLASIDAVGGNGMSYGPQEFIDGLERESGGRLTAEVDLTTFGGNEADTEMRLVEAIAEGRVDGGWPSTRAFAGAGITGLEVVEAPLTITSYSAAAELVESPTADALLTRLDGTGVVGLGLAVGPLRRPMAADAPLLEPDDWSGLAIRSYASPVQDATIRALGATPVHVTYTWPEEVRAGRLHGLEFDVAQYRLNGMTTEAGRITGNVVLWPKVLVLSLSEQTWEALTDEQRGWVEAAAEHAVTASVEGRYDEDRVVQELCRAGATVHIAGDEQLDALADAVAPVLASLSTDPLLADLQRIGANHDPDILDAARCRPKVTYSKVAPSELTVPDTPSSLPDGTYRVEIDIEDIRASGLGPPAYSSTGIWTLTVSGTEYAIDCAPLRNPTGIDCAHAEELPDDFDYNPREVGVITGDDDVAYFHHDKATEAGLTDCDPQIAGGPLSCFPSSTNRVSWSLDGDELTFSDLVADEPALYYIVEPWRRIG
ncbi:TRAP transporter substrate-binding protein [Nostocoides sp. F2B08]|uniref:TRAP transporter substrate-binding protein n=1 Tax=Nostocoides sp. F2B08 TaxID=2653936 RepID=UPI00186B50BE|nr:hypothetical protein [Tetrasphaera sp. F2B08]